MRKPGAFQVDILVRRWMNVPKLNGDVFERQERKEKERRGRNNKLCVCKTLTYYFMTSLALLYEFRPNVSEILHDLKTSQQ